MKALNQLKAVLVFIAIFHLAFGFGLMMNVMTSVFFGIQALLLTYLLWRTTRKKQETKRITINETHCQSKLAEDSWK